MDIFKKRYNFSPSEQESFHSPEEKDRTDSVSFTCWNLRVFLDRLIIALLGPGKETFVGQEKSECE